MSASGKSSNRHYEEGWGYTTGGGHGIYAAAGDRQYRSEQAAKHDRGEKHNTQRCPDCSGTGRRIPQPDGGER